LKEIRLSNVRQTGTWRCVDVASQGDSKKTTPMVAPSARYFELLTLSEINGLKGSPASFNLLLSAWRWA